MKTCAMHRKSSTMVNIPKSIAIWLEMRKQTSAQQTFSVNIEVAGGLNLE